MIRVPRALVVSLVLMLGGPSTASAAPCWFPPVDGTITDPFRAPPCPYCPGNRGLEYRVSGSVPVRAVASGIVTWAGTIGGVTYVVVRHADGLRATYGHLVSAARSAGDVVLARGIVGTVDDRFHFGLRRGDRYVDPTPVLGEIVGRPRLVPIDGRAARPAPAPRLRCR
jgi:murein DD-endopeptidase MepM/ murein hydrolase activator NlpD